MLFGMDHARSCRWVVFRGAPGIHNVIIGAAPALCENAWASTYQKKNSEGPLKGTQPESSGSFVGAVWMWDGLGLCVENHCFSRRAAVFLVASPGQRGLRDGATALRNIGETLGGLQGEY